MERSSIVYLIAVGRRDGDLRRAVPTGGDTFLPQAVPVDRLSVAMALNAARGSVAQMSGTAAGGSLVAVVGFVPFLAYALSVGIPPSAAPRDTAGADPPPEARGYGKRAVGAGAPTHPVYRAVRDRTQFVHQNLSVIVLAQGWGIRPGQIGTHRPLSAWPTGSW
jgi:hypothetical protein